MVQAVDTKVDDVDVQLFFGVEDGSTYRSLSSWLRKKENRFLIFIEDQESAFLSAKQLPLAKDPKVRLLFFKEGDEEIFQQIAWEFVFLRFAYPSAQTPEQEDFFYKMEHYRRGVDLLASDSEDRGLKVLKNVLQNLALLPQAKQGTSLAGKCAGMPAIICGAGPSLEEAIPLLESLKSQAILIAGGSAAAALSRHGIVPHLVAHLDPEPPLQRFLNQENFETPCFYQSRVSHALLERVHGPLIWMPGGGSYAMEDWLPNACGLFSERVDGGWTASNFCASIAAHLGCSCIIFVGMDLSCGPDGVYASNLSGDEHILIELEKDTLYSKRDWLMSAQWFGAFAKAHPEIQWVNATARGIDLPGIPRKTLSDVVSTLTSSWDVQGMIDSVVSEAQMTGVSLETTGHVKKQVLESFEKGLKLCDALLKIWEKHFPKSPLQVGEYLLLDHDLEQEICCRCFLSPLWSVWKRPILRGPSHPLGEHVHRLLFFKTALEMHLSYLRTL